MPANTKAAAAAKCDYYGCLPRLVRHPALLRAVCAPHGGEDATARPTALHASLQEGGSGSLPSTYSLSKPLTYDIAKMPAKPPSSLRLVVVSDTHERHHEMTLPPGDVLVHCGDILEGFNFIRDSNAMLADFAAWFNDPVLHPHPVKLIIAGNHDKALAAMSKEAVCKLFAPATYLCEDSVVLEPVGVRVYGSPRSISNSRLSPNTAFQGSKAWKPFMFAAAQDEAVETATPFARTSHDGSAALRVRLEGPTPGGPVDILMVHQSPDTPKSHHTVEEQLICTFVQQVAPRRVVLCGHLHGAYGMHRLPVPLIVKDSFHVERRGERGGGAETVDSSAPLSEEIPFLPCINATMMISGSGRTVLLSPSVIDLEL